MLRSTRVLVAFTALFVSYHLPEILVGLNVPATVAPLFLLLFFPAAAFVARWLGSDFSRAYALEWNGHAARWLGFMFLAALLAKALALAGGIAFGVYAVSGSASPSQDGSLR